MLTIDKLFSGTVLIGPIIAGALLTGVLFAGEDGTSLPVTLFQLFLATGFLFFALAKVIKADLSIELYGLEKHYLIFTGLILFSIIYTPEREDALLLAVRYLVLLSMTYLIYNSIKDEEELKRVCYLAIGIAILIAAGNLVQTYLNPQIAAMNYTSSGSRLVRSSGAELDPNIFASNYFLPLMLLVTFFTRAKTLFGRLFLFSGIGLIIGSVLLTYSRSAWISVGLGVLVIVYMTKDIRLLGYLFISFLIAFVLSETIQQLTFSFLERLLDIFAGSSDDSSKFRIILAVTAILIILDSYLLGVGFDGFSAAFKTYHPPETTQGIFDAHNEYYAVFAELGLIGFLLFLAILYQIFKTLTRTIKETENDLIKTLSTGLFATFICYLVFYNFIGGMLVNSIFFILIGLIFTTQKLAFSQSQERDLIA